MKTLTPTPNHQTPSTRLVVLVVRKSDLFENSRCQFVCTTLDVERGRGSRTCLRLQIRLLYQRWTGNILFPRIYICRLGVHMGQMKACSRFHVSDRLQSTNGGLQHNVLSMSSSLSRFIVLGVNVKKSSWVYEYRRVSYVQLYTGNK